MKQIEFTSDELRMLQQATAMLYAKRANKSVKMYNRHTGRPTEIMDKRDILHESADEAMRLLVKLGKI